MAGSAGNAVMLVHAIGLPFKDYIQEGDNGLWPRALANPQEHVAYIIINSSAGQKSQNPDNVYVEGYLKHKDRYNQYFATIYNRNGYLVMARKNLLRHPNGDIRMSALAKFKPAITLASAEHSSILKLSKPSKVTHITVQAGDSESTIVRSVIRSLDPQHQLSPAQEAYVEGTMVSDMGSNDLIQPGQTVTVNMSTMHKLINASHHLSAGQLAAWQAYGVTIAY